MQHHYFSHIVLEQASALSTCPLLISNLWQFCSVLLEPYTAHIRTLQHVCECNLGSAFTVCMEVGVQQKHALNECANHGLYSLPQVSCHGVSIMCKL